MERKLSILFLAPMDSIHSKRWIRYFADKNHTVHVLSFDVLNESELTDMNHVHFHQIKLYQHNLPRVLKYALFILNVAAKARKIKALIRDINPDIIHLHLIDFRGLLLPGLRIPIVMTAWGSDILVFPQKNFIYKYIVRKVLGRADMITCDAEHMRQAIGQFGIPAGKIEVIYFGTDLTKFNPGKKDPDIRKELGFEDDAKLVISLRSLHPIYDIATLMRAIPLVLEKVAQARFIVVGDGPERTNLMQLSRELNVQDKVRFVGRLPDQDLQRYTASADIYVSTSLSDAGLAASTAEAMACEVPVIITDFGNNSEWVENNKSGLLFRLQDYRELADKIISLLNDPEKAAGMAREGRMVIEERNNWHKEMEKVESLYLKYSLRRDDKKPV